jgi:hypothetical protein
LVSQTKRRARHLGGPNLYKSCVPCPCTYLRVLGLPITILHRIIYYLGYPLGRFAGLKHRQQEICFQTRFKYAMETTFRYPAYHLILHWKRHLANPRRDDVSLPHVSFNSTLESLPLQLCSQPLTGNSFAIDRLGTEPFPVSCALDLIPSSLFLEMMSTLDVWMEVLVLHHN